MRIYPKYVFEILFICKGESHTDIVVSCGQTVLAKLHFQCRVLLLAAGPYTASDIASTQNAVSQ